MKSLNKFSLFRSILVTCLLLHLVYLVLIIYVLSLGASIVIMHPLLPVNEWGQLNMRTPFIQFVLTLVSAVYIFIFPKRYKTNEVKDNGKK